MPQGQYTFGPLGSASAGTTPPPEKKQSYTFGPIGNATLLPDAIAGAEGSKPGDNNPGNLSVPVAKQVGMPTAGSRPSTGVGATEIAKFASPEVGKEALTKYLGSFPPGTTIEQLGQKYAPGQPDWVSNVSKKLGVSKTATLGSLRGAGAVPAPASPAATSSTKVEDKSRIKSADPFSSGVASGMGFDPKTIEAASKFKLGDKLYPVAHPMTQQGAEIVKQAAHGMSQWMESVAKDPFHIVDPLESMARVVEFHTGTKWDAFGLHKAGIEETALDEIGKGIKSGNTDQLEHGAGRLVGGLSNIFAGVEGPEVAKGLKTLPGKIVENIHTAKEARNKAVVTAAANNVLQADAKNVIIPTIVQAVKNTWDSVGRRANNIDDADVVANKTAGKTGSTPTTDVAQLFADAKIKAKGQKIPTPETSKILKNVLSKQGTDMTWGDLKRFRTIVGDSAKGASGIDSAVLWSVYDGLEKKMRARAIQLGKADAFNEYVDTTRKLKAHESGVISKLQGADTGLKLYTELAKESNKPELNDMFNLLERHGGVPAGFVDDLVKTRKAVYKLAQRADQGDEAGGRMAALMRHPLAAGTAMAGVSALSGFSPIGIGGSFVASLVAAKKVDAFLTRYEAVKAMRAIRRAQPPNFLKGLPTPFPGGASPSLTPPSGGGTPRSSGPVTPSGTPPVGPSAPVSPSVGAPSGATSLEGLMSKIKESMKPGWQREMEGAGTKADKAVAEQRKHTEAVLKGETYASLPGQGSELVDPTTFEKGYKTAGTKELSSEAKESQKVLDKAKTGREPVSETSKASKQTPYEEFGVKIDRDRLTTPEAVREAKADAKAQIEELGRAKYIEASKLPVGEARTAALAKLKKDVASASRSVDKMQTPEVSRKQRDVLRKAVDAGKVSPKEQAVLENMSPEQVEQKAASGITDDESNMMELIDLGREAESYGGAVEKVYNEIYKKTGGDPRSSLPMLRALMDQVRRAKKPAAD